MAPLPGTAGARCGAPAGHLDLHVDLGGGGRAWARDARIVSERAEAAEVEARRIAAQAAVPARRVVEARLGSTRAHRQSGLFRARRRRRAVAVGAVGTLREVRTRVVQLAVVDAAVGADGGHLGNLHGERHGGGVLRRARCVEVEGALDDAALSGELPKACGVCGA